LSEIAKSLQRFEQELEFGAWSLSFKFVPVLRDQAEKNTTTYCCKLELELGLELEVSLVPALRELKGTMQQTVGSLSLSLSSWKFLELAELYIQREN
jgi:hypothetical protein